MIVESVIYEEELDSCFAELALEKALNTSILLFDMIYFEGMDDKTSSEKFKSLINRIIEAFKSFIIKCKDYLKAAVNKITGRVTDTLTEFNLKYVIQSFDASIAKAEKLGMKTFKFIDMKALLNCLDDECNMYEKAIKKFSREYIRRGAPKDAEKMLQKFNKISEKYDTKLKDILNEDKEFSIREAKHIVYMIQNCKSVRKGGYTDIVDRYSAMCDDIEKITVGTLKSLNSYSEDTGYIQNAKTLQQMIHNSCVRIHTHSAECITAILRYGIPIICKIDKMAHTNDVDTGTVDKDGLRVYEVKDTSSPEHQRTRNIVSDVSKAIGDSAYNTIKSVRKVVRKTDIKDWKFTKGESPLTFDRKRDLTDNEKIDIGYVKGWNAVGTAIKLKNIKDKYKK